MPIYEYRCERCEEEFEVSQRITADALTEHDECGGEVKRLISRTSFALKGKGWYSDHYGLQQKSTGQTDTVDPGSPKKDAGSPKNGEAKTASKSESSGGEKSASSTSSSTNSSTGTGQAGKEKKEKKASPSSASASGSGKSKD